MRGTGPLGVGRSRPPAARRSRRTPRQQRHQIPPIRDRDVLPLVEVRHDQDRGEGHQQEQRRSPAGAVDQPGQRQRRRRARGSDRAGTRRPGPRINRAGQVAQQHQPVRQVVPEVDQGVHDDALVVPLADRGRLAEETAAVIRLKASTLRVRQHEQRNARYGQGVRSQRGPTRARRRPRPQEHQRRGVGLERQPEGEAAGQPRASARLADGALQQPGGERRQGRGEAVRPGEVPVRQNLAAARRQQTRRDQPGQPTTQIPRQQVGAPDGQRPGHRHHQAGRQRADAGQPEEPGQQPEVQPADVGVDVDQAIGAGQAAMQQLDRAEHLASLVREAGDVQRYGSRSTSHPHQAEHQHGVKREHRRTRCAFGPSGRRGRGVAAAGATSGVVKLIR